MDSKQLSSRLREMAVNTGTLNCLGCGYENSCGTRGCAVLKKAAEIVERTTWVSVNDTLPDIGVRVLTLDKWKHTHDRTLHQYRSGGLVFSPDGLIPASDVTHWMPLPEPPKEEKP